jgi:uncharacterized membrane protein YeiH
MNPTALLGVVTLLADTSQDKADEALGALQTVLEYAGTVAFGISGALVAGRKKMDLAGVVVLGTIVAVGGGTTRDLLLGNPVFWVGDPTYLLVGAAAALLTIPLFRSGGLDVMRRFDLVDLSDAAGLALFVTTGTAAALAAGAGSAAAAVIGVISGTAGGIIRDILANKIPDVLSSGRLYMVAAFAGAALYVLLLQLSLTPLITVWIPILVTFGLRVMAMRFGWSVPTFDINDQE